MGSFSDITLQAIREAAELFAASILAAHGVDLIDVSAGQTVPHQKPVYGRQFQTPFADRIRHEVGIATMAVGNISSYMDVNTILAAGRADLCAMARAHLWDPYWTRNAAWRLGWRRSSRRVCRQPGAAATCSSGWRRKQATAPASP